MKKVIALLILMALISMFSSCSIQTQEASSVVSPQLSTSPVPTASAVSETPSPSPSKTEKTCDYYIIHNNMDYSRGKEGVIDSKGNIVLPPKFASVQILQQDNSPTLFFTEDGTAHIKDKTTVSNGGLYDTSCKMINGTAYESVYTLNNRLIKVIDENGLVGALSYTGKEIIACKYNDIYICGGNTVAFKINNNADKKICPNISAYDIYDTNGTFLRSKDVITPDETYYYTLNNYKYGLINSDYIVFCNSSELKFGLMDTSFNIVTPLDWDEADPCGGDKAIVRSSGKYGVIDKTGKLIIPLNFSGIEAVSVEEDKKDITFSASSPQGAYIFDSSGNQIFFSNKYAYVKEDNGVIIAKDSDGMEHALDRGGNDIIPPANRIAWDPLCLYYTCVDNNSSTSFQDKFTYYSKSGALLPLSEYDLIEAVSSDKFIVSLKPPYTKGYGICDSNGKLVVPDTYSSIQNTYNDKNLLFFSQEDKYGITHSGIMDMNGNIILPAVFNIINETDGNVFYAETGSLCGLIDIKGNWLYRTSKYGSLMD